MAELVDALDSKSSFRKEVGVRFPLPAPPGLVVSGRTDADKHSIADRRYQ